VPAVKKNPQTPKNKKQQQKNPGESDKQKEKNIIKVFIIIETKSYKNKINYKCITAN